MEPLLGPVDLTRLHSAGPLHASSAFIDCLRGGTWGAVPATGERSRITNNPLNRIDWVVPGGESGSNARPMHPEWVRSLRNQCKEAGVAFFFKQWGAWAPGAPLYPQNDEEQELFDNLDFGADLMALEHDGEIAIDYQPRIGAWVMERAGKKQAGRLLDGRTWDEFPETAA
jgi:hypothetical protein